MANKIVKIDKSSLPLVSSTNKYFVRYRVVSDKIRNSDWSEIFEISGKDIIQVDGVVTLVTTADKKIINLVWENTNSSPIYDIFVSWSGGSYSYHGSSVSTSYGIIAPSQASSVDITIQIGSAQKQLSSTLKIFENHQTV